MWNRNGFQLWIWHEYVYVRCVKCRGNFISSTSIDNVPLMAMTSAFFLWSSTTTKGEQNNCKAEMYTTLIRSHIEHCPSHAVLALHNGALLL